MGPQISGQKLLVMFVCLVQSYLALGLIYGFSVMYADLINVFSTSRLNSALIQGVFNLVAFGGGILWTVPINRFGVGLCMVVGAVLGCIGFFTSSFARNSQTIIACTGVICGFGISIGYLGPFAIVGLLYSEDPGFPLALLTVAGSLGQITMPLIYDGLLTAFHWSGAFIILASITLQGLPCSLVIHYSSDLLVSKDDRQESSSSGACDKELLTDYVIWLFIISIVLLFGTVNFELWFLVDQMISLGYSQQFGTMLLSVLGCANLAGRIFGSVLKLRIRAYPAIYNMFYLCPLIAVGHTLVIILQHKRNWMIVACIVHGFGFGVINALAPVMTYDLVESDKFLQAVAQLSLSFGIANLLSNFVGGEIRDVYGEYDVAYELAIVVSLIVTLDFMIIACVTRKRQKERESLLKHDSLQNTPYKTID